MEKTDTRATAFGRVLGALMERRGIPAEPGAIKALAERSGFDGEKFLARVAGGSGSGLGDLGGLARELGLSEREMKGLASAYVYEKDPACAVPGCARPAQVGNGLGDCEEHRAEYDARADMEAWGLAWKILGPWVESTREIGSDELTQVMEGALVEVDEAGGRARDELERAEAALGGPPRGEGGGGV